MKFEEIQPQQPEILDEVKMSTSVFDQFINSSESEGIKAGFEAELIFSGLGGSSSETDYDNPEMDESQDTRPDSIDEICDFFDDGDYNDRRRIRRLRENLEESYNEWRYEKMEEEWSSVEEQTVRDYIVDNKWDEQEQMVEYMSGVLELSPEEIAEVMSWRDTDPETRYKQRDLFRGDETYAYYSEAKDAVASMLDDMVEESISSNDEDWENAKNEWEGDFSGVDEEDWLRDTGMDWMTDVYREQDIGWPHWEYPETTTEGGYNVENAKRLASDLERQLDVTTKVASGYHSATRSPGVWIFEPDGSLDADDEDDMPVEIVSPPMPIKECLELMPQFFEWAKSNDAYSNGSTGFHVGVSLPDVGGRVDYMKLALFLGDEYVLDKFERGTNYFAKSSMSKLRDELKSGKISEDQVQEALNKMKNSMIQYADQVIKRGGGAHGKYTSINMKGDYIEFRSMGNTSYFNDPNSINMVMDTVKRYVYAMHIASQPELFKNEYAKKLYKLLEPGSTEPSILQLFVNYSAGELPKDALIRQVRQQQLSRDIEKDKVRGKYWWNVQWDINRRIEVVASNKAEAKMVAAQEWRVPVEQLAGAKVTPIKPFKDSPGGVGNWAIMSGGQQVFRITASNQGEANQKAREWLRGRSEEYRREHAGEEVEVVPV